jgi:HEAT repeat protein
MLDLLFDSGFNPPVTAAIWGTVASVGVSLLLLLYTLELRIRRRFSERRRARVVARWRVVIANAITSPDAFGDTPPPKLPRRERKEFLRLWNNTRNMIEGQAADSLIALAYQLNFFDFVRWQAKHSNFGSRLMAIQTLGHLRDMQSWDFILGEVDDENPILSITAAEALVEIDPARAVLVLIPKLAERRDWPKTHVFRLLQRAGSEAVSEPLYRAIRTGSDSDAVYLLQYAVLAEFDVRDAIATELLASRVEPEVIAAALKVASGYSSVPRLDEYQTHEVWYVRMQAARLLGRLARPEDASRLESLLTDAEWWVRYRAATALVRLPALNKPDLERIRSRQTDPFAKDILEQAIAEAGAR